MRILNEESVETSLKSILSFVQEKNVDAFKILSLYIWNDMSELRRIGGSNSDFITKECLRHMILAQNLIVEARTQINRTLRFRNERRRLECVKLTSV